MKKFSYHFKFLSKSRLYFIVLIFSLWIKNLDARTCNEISNISYTNDITTAEVASSGVLNICISYTDFKKIKAKGWVSYKDFGAKGDGKTDDIDAINAAHAFANKEGLEVRIDDESVYYIGGKERTVIIQTNTDFGSAQFIIDDTHVENRNASIFLIQSDTVAFTIEGISKLEKNQKNLNRSFSNPCLITVENSHQKQYIRYGPNQDMGSDQTDIFIVDENGLVDLETPIIWDFDQITNLEAKAIEKTTLTIKGGRFTTIANQASSHYTYYSRNIEIQRSNVIVDGLEHRVEGEGETGAPYRGFLNISNCAYVTIKNTVLTGHKTYRTIGRAGSTVPMGSYDITANHAIHLSFINCSQTNDIHDVKYWGIFGSNYCKNITFDGCKLSRFDAHKGVYNAIIKNSELGHMGINAIGKGFLLVENTTIRARSLINLRSDYGSTWEGQFMVRNSVFEPTGDPSKGFALINGHYSGQHDFGYTCYMPEVITFENVQILDSRYPESYLGPAIFANFNPELNSSQYVEQFPYIKTKKVIIKNMKTSSGQPVRMSDNDLMFKDVNIK